LKEVIASAIYSTTEGSKPRVIIRRHDISEIPCASSSNALFQFKTHSIKKKKDYESIIKQSKICLCSREQRQQSGVYADCSARARYN